MSRNPTRSSDRRARRWWLGFSLFALILVGGLVQISRVTLTLEADNRHAAAVSEQRERLRDTLWTIDGFLSRILADEADRGAGEAWFSPLEGQEFPSPLASEDRPLFLCRFESNPVGEPTLVETVPDFCDNSPEPEKVAQSRSWVAGNDLQEVYNDAQMLSCTTLGATNQIALEPDEGFDAVITERAAEEPEAKTPSPIGYVENGYGNPQKIDALSQSRRNMVSMNSRTQRGANIDIEDMNFSLAAVNPTVDDTGLLLPHWSSVEGSTQLAFLRQVFREGALRVQGFTVDWPVLQQELLLLAEPLLPGLRFEPLVGEAVRELRWVGCSLASLPLGIITPEIDLAPATGATPARLALGLTWLAVLGAIAVAFASLRSSIAFGERRSRFASAVTHELRTPLTTFQLYSEMLADGMVPDESQRREYLETLCSESKRLSGLVESVLSYSRLEEGRDERRHAPIAVGALVDRVGPRAERPLAAAGLSLAVSIEPLLREESIVTDADAVEQILGNLIENAAKYAAGSDPARVELTVTRGEGRLALRLRDHGPGVDPECGRRIFEPFDRAGHESGTIPGAGLGLSIARALARDLGGDLVLDDLPADGGTSFTLTLPAHRTA